MKQKAPCRKMNLKWALNNYKVVMLPTKGNGAKGCPELRVDWQKLGRHWSVRWVKGTCSFCFRSVSCSLMSWGLSDAFTFVTFPAKFTSQTLQAKHCHPILLSDLSLKNLPLQVLIPETITLPPVRMVSLLEQVPIYCLSHIFINC